jgi:porphobilinogen synthase
MEEKIMGFPDLRLRRLRSGETIRNMFAAPMPGPEKFIWPVFVVEGTGIKQAINALPGQFRYSIDTLLEAVGEVMSSGIKSVMIFGVVGDNRKDETASYAWNPEGLVQKAVYELKNAYPSLMVFTDVCVCEYTSHGHCGIINEKGRLVNDKSLKILAEMAVSHAQAGSDGVAPSAMLDGQVQAIRNSLDKAEKENTLIMSYSTKFASAMYGPFREAANSAPTSEDRKSYQADYRDWRSAIRESLEDESEGADVLMVKPSLFYLDIISRIRQSTQLPLAAYNVSGEYSMLIATAERGWGDLKSLVRESIHALSRSGTDIFISYWANQYDKLLRD